MKWKGVNPIVHLVDRIYQNGIKLTKKIMKVYENNIKRSKILPRWDVTIMPTFW